MTAGAGLIALCVLALGVPSQTSPDTPAFPDVPTLFQQVLANQNQLEGARDEYTYTKTESDIETDERGQVREKAARTLEVFSVDGKRVEKLIRRNGRPLTGEETRKEEARIEKEIREHKRRRSEGKTGARRRAGGGEGDDDELTVSDLLRVCQFVNPRREPFRGEPVLAYDFEPRPGSRPRGRVESWIQRLRGSLWIDEDARRILRLEARVTDSLKVGGGLVFSVRRGSTLVFEQALVNDEVWLPSYAEVKLSARFLLLKGYDIHQTQRFSDYKKFSVETSSEIKPPEQ